MNQDKGRGTLPINKTVYSKKCLEVLGINQFNTLSTHTKKKTEEKIQQVLRKIKRKFSIQEYVTIKPTGFCPGKFYVIAKVYKPPVNGTVDQILIRRIVSSIGPVTYQLAKYLENLLSSLIWSKNTLK